MPLWTSFYVHPLAKPTPGTRIHLRSKHFDYVAPFDKPANQNDNSLFVPLGAGPLDLDIDIYTGQSVPLELRISGLPDDLQFVAIGLPSRAHESRFSIAGNILHKPAVAGAEGCVVTCLHGNHTSGNGMCCVECENEDAIVKICC